MDVLDTAGEEEYLFTTMFDAYVREANGVLLFFSLTQGNGDYKSYYEKVIKTRSDDFPVVIVGTKVDIFSGDPNKTEAAKFALQHNIPFIATSAKENVGVTEAFERLTRLIIGRVTNVKSARNTQAV
jgi:small GTP-binding protein